MNRKFWLILLSCMIAACTAADDRPDAKVKDPCVIRTNGAPPSCEVAATQLVAAGDDFEGKIISVSLYYPGYEASLMFSGKEAAEIHDLSSAFVFDRHAQVGASRSDDSAGLSPGYYRVRARFLQAGPLTIGEGVVMPLVVAGRLVDLTQLEKITTVGEIRDDCDRLSNCKMNYLHGFYPIPTLLQPPGP